MAFVGPVNLVDGDIQMINKREILEIATATGLSPQVVEKDYVLGWLLWGIQKHPILAQHWVFKGGTCLKKCFFETYRFSEDLDFTLSDEAYLEESFLIAAFQEIAEWVYDQTGIEVPVGLQKFDVYQNPRGHPSCQGRIAYRGPVSPRANNIPRIKLDLTADERIVLPAVRASVFHPYSDAPEDGISVLTYAYEEAFAEKTRALGERTRPRDLYDVINLFRHQIARPDAAVLLDVLSQKCAFKDVPVPTFEALAPFKAELDGGWAGMLAHQLPELPSVDAFWAELPQFFQWLNGRATAPVLQPYGGQEGEQPIHDVGWRLPVHSHVQAAMEIIRFAAANQLCVDLTYQSSVRRIEPYSMRRTLDGNIILHAHSVDKDQHRSYRIDRIEGAAVTSQSFSPRFTIELSPRGNQSIPATAASGAITERSLKRSSVARRAPRSRTPKLSSTSRPSGPTYVYQCGLCMKQFKRKSQNGQLKAHKNALGMPCGGRQGYLVDVIY